MHCTLILLVLTLIVLSYHLNLSVGPPTQTGVYAGWGDGYRYSPQLLISLQPIA